MNLKRLTTLKEVSRIIGHTLGRGEDFPDAVLGDFVDDFRLRAKNSEEKATLVHEEPERVAVEGYRDVNAYLAGVAETLCREAGLTPPAWTEKSEYFLPEPWFAGGLENLKAILLVESPVPFRRRNLFVSQNAMTRV
ncbi:MAG: hypothetical protein HY892_02745 [Deltaproteobacteria bacterium]|nr:hypothetical protein [Deltaproteobacteria bacterium]